MRFAIVALVFFLGVSGYVYAGQQPFLYASIGASSSSVVAGQPSYVVWNTGNATAVFIQPDIGFVSTSGSLIVTPAETTTYTLTASNQYSSVVSSTTIYVVSDTEQQPAAANENQPPVAPLGPEQDIYSYFSPKRQNFTVPRESIENLVSQYNAGRLESISVLDNGTNVAYYVASTSRDVTVFFIFHTTLKTYFYFEPENLTIFKVEKPFWSFLAS